MEKINNENERLGYMNESKQEFLKRTKIITNKDKLTPKKPDKTYEKPDKTYEKPRKSNLYNFKSLNKGSNKKIKLKIHLTYLKRIKSRYQTLKKKIIDALIKSNFQTSIELSKFIDINYNAIYKRNTISEACSQLIFEKIIKKRNRNNGERGRPKIEFYIETEKEEL